MKLSKIFLTILVVAFALSNIVILYSLYNQSLSPSTSSAASDGKYLLNLISPTSLSSAAVNSTVTIGLYAQNTTDVTAGEVVLSYDPTVVQGVQMVEDSNILLALNKKIDNNTGKITIDIAYMGSGFLPADTTLVRFDFKVVDNTKNGTTVSLAPGSTLGVPNKLATNGMGSLPINFGTVQAQPICGNGIKESAEQCDDGNLRNGDGCSSSCRDENTTTPPPPTNPGTTPPVNPPTVNPTNPNNTSGDTPTNIPEDTASDESIPEEPRVPDTNVQISDDTVTTTSTSSNPKTSNNNVAPADNRNLLTVLLIITISGTLASLFFLVRELFVKKEEPNANPFM